MRNELVILRTIRNAQETLRLAITMIEDAGAADPGSPYNATYPDFAEAAELIANAARRLPR